MVVTLDALENAGLAERRLSSTDRRARIIAVTRAGADLVAKAESVITEIYREVLDSLPSDERKAFVAALTRLAQGRLSTPVPCEKPPRRRAARAPEPVK
jgi:DNA-binding MarR family transcriptional regulator